MKLTDNGVDFYKRFYDEVPIGLYRTSIKDGIFLKANPFLVNLLGFNSLEEMISYGLKSSDLYPPEKRQELLEAIKSHCCIQDFEIEITLPKTKEKKWISVTAKIYEKEGYLEGSIMDVTRRKSAEKDVIDLRQLITNLQKIKETVDSRIQSYDSALTF